MDIGTTTSLSSPKSSAVPDRSLSGSRETNENEQPLNQKPKTKNFMSPTISAASKASSPFRKKILAERNELASSCESLPPHKATNLGSKASSLNSTSQHSGKVPISSYSYASESDNDDQENNSVVDSSYKPYDPLTNDLGPRPKYLRYQPNRRRGIFLDIQKSDDNQGSLQQAQDPSNLPEKYNLEPENAEDLVDSVEDDEEMEEDVDREWNLKGLFKILVLLAVFFLSCSNLSSMDSVVSSGSGDMIRKNILQAVFHEIYGSESVYMDQPEYSQSGFLELSQREVNYDVQAVESVEDIVELLEVESTEMEETTEPQEGLTADIDQDSIEVEVAQSVHGDEEEQTMSTTAGEVTCSNEINEEVVQSFDEQLQRDQALEKNDPEQENLEVLLDDISSTNANELKFELTEADNKVEQVENTSQEQTGEVEISDTVSEGAQEIETESEFEISNLDTEIELENAVVEEIGPSNAVIIIGVAAASVLLVASLVIIYVTRKPKASIGTPQAEIPKTSSVIASVEGEILEKKTETSAKVSSLQEPLDDPSKNSRNSHLERTPAIVSITQASSLCEPTKEASKEISHISAPKIELLGEMMVGEVSSSLRSCVRKNSMIAAEGSNTNLSKGVLPPTQPSVVDHSITDSPSYGSFTAEKKILKKKVEKDGEEIKKVVLTTPVRRSSRIRDRIGMSP